MARAAVTEVVASAAEHVVDAATVMVVVVRVRDDPGAHAQERERLNLQMSRLLRDLALVQRCTQNTSSVL